ncbi:MAG: hypothetical protein PUK18_03140, partial [Firmicutes bacterium]|nr:hypothetical protein [Bacillota bacterium]MDY6160028.1 hypothetical protein [Candidatus Faecousia sp.]
LPPPKRGKYLSISVKTNPVHNLEQAAGASPRPTVCTIFPYDNHIAKHQFLRPAVGALPDLARYTDNLQKAGVESSFCFLDGIPPIML